MLVRTAASYAPWWVTSFQTEPSCRRMTPASTSVPCHEQVVGPSMSLLSPGSTIMREKLHRSLRSPGTGDVVGKFWRSLATPGLEDRGDQRPLRLHLVAPRE